MGTRSIFCNRTLNMRAIKAVGYDMDYTLVHYRVEHWEKHAYEALQERLLALSWPVGHLRFDPGMVIRGLIIDTEQGNLLKANRFGIVKRALHGTRPLDFELMRRAYSGTVVDLGESRWSFLNTLFSLSEGCMYAQLVDLLDERKLPGVMGYRDLYKTVRHHMDAAHADGRMKATVVSRPEQFVLTDEETTLALLDQRHAGKKLLLITNSDWSYTRAMMSFAFEPFLPPGTRWQSLFDLIVAGARKPDFFTTRSPFFEVATDDGLLRPLPGKLETGKAYVGGSATQLEEDLGLSGDEILYVGDHMFGDVHVTKNVLRWRTALILRELEAEVGAIEAFGQKEAQVAQRMAEKEQLEELQCQLRLKMQRLRSRYGPTPTEAEGALVEQLNDLRARLEALDREIAPLARAATELNNPRWGLLTRAGNDKSHLARQVERYSDIYTSRVSNFLKATPFVYLRSPRGSLPHDPIVPGGVPLAPSSG